MITTNHNAAAEEWNRKYPIGTEVIRYALINPLEISCETKTRSEALVTGTGRAVIMTEDIHGYCALESVVPKRGAMRTIQQIKAEIDALNIKVRPLNALLRSLNDELRDVIALEELKRKVCHPIANPDEMLMR